MKAKDIVDALRKTPFRPFEVWLVNGQVFRVAHPDCILFSRHKTSCVLAEGDHFRYFDLDHVSSLGLKQNGGRRKKSKRR